MITATQIDAIMDEIGDPHEFAKKRFADALALGKEKYPNRPECIYAYAFGWAEKEMALLLNALRIAHGKA